MDYAQISDNLFVFQCRLKQAEREYHGFVKKAAWSDEICFKVDLLIETITTCKREIAQITEMMRAEI